MHLITVAIKATLVVLSLPLLACYNHSTLVVLSLHREQSQHNDGPQPNPLDIMVALMLPSACTCSHHSTLVVLIIPLVSSDHFLMVHSLSLLQSHHSDVLSLPLLPSQPTGWALAYLCSYLNFLCGPQLIPVDTSHTTTTCLS